jgi:four helix bundle protein
MGNFQKLLVWQRAKDLAVKVYRVTSTPKFSKDFGLKDQIQRSAVSVPSNISEGNELGTDKQSVRYFYIAKGSLAELITQITIAYEIGYLDLEIRDSFFTECRVISIMLHKLIKSRS